MTWNLVVGEKDGTPYGSLVVDGQAVTIDEDTVGELFVDLWSNPRPWRETISEYHARAAAPAGVS